MVNHIQSNFKITTKIVAKWLILLFVGLFTAFPFIWMVVSSLKTKLEVMDVKIFLPKIPQWSNFLEVLFHSPIPRYIWNSLWTSLIIVVIQMITGAMLAYALVFLKFKGRHLLFSVIMSTYMLPTAATYIPSYIILSKGGMLNTLTGLIVSSTISIFGIFLLRQAFMQIPKALVEAAWMDGAAHFRVLWEILYPMTKSSFSTFGWMSFIAAYNSYMWPSLITNDQSKYLVSQGLRSFFIEGGAYGTEWAKVMAASTVIVAPLLVIFAVAQKWFIKGVGGETGMKG
ncbi:MULTISPECIES: carbohydrate ABC transporter permease [unclassified Streptococcus]|uniref:carbohydrate ABC transporter permease n=1 Tax=unclassified Streptococcus TaxID=2608887 RepID=UPI0010729A7D|nr:MULTISPECIES: carbohydrate ABC transporter permease [unclassified Streptococcus]MBF0786998.1 carbohydrate ABC transporter permease [Streptococcus sp. 19428wC2_LYSM12]MCQ9212610.1 carbohydrate ABC transporter permease [Streptococcus sp. B01]MCQ9213949.1 carbohydrate ABC transporter permease [Streptococcus sp. O1]TFV06036.1 carbohydrate ABC transporter permease [Streptococcus sp. LYSM12]